MSKLVASLILSLLCISLSGQSIQWNHLLLPGDIHVVAKDSSEKSMAVFKSRLFLYDSLQRISKETGVAFFEHDYIAEFKKPQEASHLAINFKGASRLMYYVRLYDDKNETHMVYNYGAIRACDADIETLILTIAHTPYLVKKVEIGTFLGKDEILKVGISNEPDGNKVIQELVSMRYKSICNKASYFTDKIELNGGVNSASYEVKPVISPDGKTLYFHRQNYKENTGGKKDDQDIYLSRFVNNDWTPAENMKAPLNDNLPNGVASVSSGETSLFLINEYVSPNQQRQGLSYSEKTINGWSFPKKIEVRNFYNRSEYMDFFISPTQNEMILAIQRDDSFGDQDLYVSFYDDATASWTEPVNLGSEVNSVISEASPFLAADGKTLYFASNGFLGYGGFDIYVTRRLDDSWTNWSYPENLGPVINTFDDDLYYTVSAAGDQAYFISAENGDRNIFRIPLPTIYKPEPVVLLTGRIFNATTAQPEEAEVSIRWHNDNEVIGTGKSDPVTGEYKLVIPAGGIYDYTINKDGFEASVGTINTIKTKNYEEKQQDIKIGTNDALRSPAIVFLSAELDERQLKVKLDNVSAFVKSFPEYKITINANSTDSSASSSLVSATKVKSYLLSRGVPSQNILEEKSETNILKLIVSSDSIANYTPVSSIPEDYIRPTKRENSDIALMVKGKVIDASTFKPVAARMIFKLNGKVKSRASSDPATGNYQTLLPANASYEITLFKDSTESKLTLKTPDVNQYQEVGFVCLINKDNFKSASFEIGSGISANLDDRAQLKWNKFLKKKKATREILNLKDNNLPVSGRVSKDLLYLAEVLKSIPSLKANVITHTSSSMKDAGTVQQALSQRVVQFLVENGVSKSNIEVKLAGDTQPKNPKASHHTNNRIVVEVSF
jgi:outer membrane protein OmpA-like peptidoglycan-associated protein